MILPGFCSQAIRIWTQQIGVNPVKVSNRIRGWFPRDCDLLEKWTRTKPTWKPVKSIIADSYVLFTEIGVILQGFTSYFPRKYKIWINSLNNSPVVWKRRDPFSWFFWRTWAMSNRPQEILAAAKTSTKFWPFSSPLLLHRPISVSWPLVLLQRHWWCNSKQTKYINFSIYCSKIISLFNLF